MNINGNNNASNSEELDSPRQHLKHFIGFIDTIIAYYSNIKNLSSEDQMHKLIPPLEANMQEFRDYILEVDPVLSNYL